MIFRKAAQPARVGDTRFHLAGLTDDFSDSIASVRTSVAPVLSAVLDDLYSHMAAHPATSPLVRDQAQIERLKSVQTAHWLKLLSGEGPAHIREVSPRVGRAHVRAGLSPDLYVSSYSFILQGLIRRLLGEKSKQTRGIVALIQILFLDMGLALSAYGETEEAEVRRQESDAVAVAVEDEMRQANAIVREQSAALAAVVDTMRKAIQGVTRGGELVERGSTTTQNGIQSVASATEEMVASSREVGRQAAETARLVQEARTRAEAASDIMLRLTETSDRISEAARLIDSIARQTNLLALNATIEAARAGAAGRGFAVVAQEVKQLSQRTAQATQEISGQIKGIGDATAEAVGAMEQISHLIVSIDSVAAGVAENADGQIKALQEVTVSAQSAASGAEHLRDSVNLINDGVHEAGLVTESVVETTDGVMQLFNRLEQRLLVTIKSFSTADSRRHPRLPARWDVEVRAGGKRLATRSIDVSEGGMLIEDPGEEVRDGETIEVHIAKLGTIRTRAEARQLLGLRVSFTHVPAEVAEELRRMLKDVEAAEIRLKLELKRRASLIADRFTAGMHGGEIGLNDLFDTDYQTIPDTNPRQVTTRALPFLERCLPEIIEPMLAFDPAVVFCAAVDRNGYLPVHNRVFSRPQTADVTSNEAYSRNRRIFDDRTGLSAARNTRDTLVQTYLRDMGGGQKILMKDVSTPIYVKGRHWGALRMGVKV